MASSIIIRLATTVSAKLVPKFTVLSKIELGKRITVVGTKETLIKGRQKALTTGYTGVHGAPEDLIGISLYFCLSKS